MIRYFSLAEANLDGERYEEARQVYQSLIDEANNLDPDDVAAAYAGLADAYNNMGRYDDAIKTSQSLLEQFEDDPEVPQHIVTARGLGYRFEK